MKELMMEKFYVFALVLLLSVAAFFGFKFYLLHEIHLVINDEPVGFYSATSTLEVPIIQRHHENILTANRISFGTFGKFLKSEGVGTNPIGNASFYILDKADGQSKSVFFGNSANNSAVLPVLSADGAVDRLFGSAISSDLELFDVCHSVDYANLSIFSSIANLRKHLFCVPIRNMYFVQCTRFFKYSLSNGIQVIRADSIEQPVVSLLIFADGAVISDLRLRGFNTEDLSLLLNTLTVQPKP